MKKHPLRKRLPQIRRKLAANLTRQRKKRGLSQQALADAAGVHRTYVSLVEREGVDPTFGVVWRLATVLRMKTGDLLR